MKVRGIIKYLYLCSEAQSFATEIKDVSFHNEWLTIHPDGEIILHASTARPYAHDGCTPKFSGLGMVWGIPDGIPIRPGWRITHDASLLHDVLLQFRDKHNIPIKIINRAFFEELRKSGFRYARLYYGLVCLYWGIQSVFSVSNT